MSIRCQKTPFQYTANFHANFQFIVFLHVFCYFSSAQIVGTHLKWDDFEKVNLPILDGAVLRTPSYDVYISKLIQCARVCIMY